ncbi:MAG TPA: TetR/AcrR family transcriptional regulator C-terminal domain-containing protein [Burkholderiales bacterium]
MSSTKRPARRRAPLSRERIVKAALALVEREGLEGFSARRLGRELGVEAMSVYHFFPSRQHLVDALVGEAVGSIEFPDEALAPSERLREVMRAYRRMAHAHAKLFPLVAVHRLNTPEGVRFIERVLRIFRDATGDDELAARYFRAAGYYLMGAGLDETSGYAKGPSAAEPVADDFVARECPQLARSARFFQRKEWDATFDLGVEALVAAIERARKSPPGAGS